MFNKIAQLLEEDDEPPSRVHQILIELKQAIANLQLQIGTISRTSSANAEKVKGLITQKKALRIKVNKALSTRGNATTSTKELNVVARKLAQYKQLQTSIDQSRIKLQERLDDLEFKRDQLIARIEVGEVDLNASQNYAEIMESLMLLQNSGDLNIYSQAITDSEYRTQALKELSQDINQDNLSELKTEPDAPSSNELGLETSFEELKSKYRNFFDSNATTEAVRLKSQRLQELATKPVDTTKIDKFFAEEDDRTSSEKADRIKSFFGRR